MQLSITDLFPETVLEEVSGGLREGKGLRSGRAGHYLTIADLLIRGYDAADLDGVDADVIAIIGGELRRLQVKASMGSAFGPGGGGPGSGWNNGCRPLSSYRGKIDAFAFVSLRKRLVYYVASEAINSRSVTINSFTHQSCDMSFNELLRRWGS